MHFLLSDFSVINLHMFRAGFLIIRMYYSVYTSVGISHVFILTGYWQDQDGTPVNINA